MEASGEGRRRSLVGETISGVSWDIDSNWSAVVYRRHPTGFRRHSACPSVSGIWGGGPDTPRSDAFEEPAGRHSVKRIAG